MGVLLVIQLVIHGNSVYFSRLSGHLMSGKPPRSSWHHRGGFCGSVAVACGMCCMCHVQELNSIPIFLGSGYQFINRDLFTHFIVYTYTVHI